MAGLPADSGPPSAIEAAKAKLKAYQAVGIEAFILSGYPHITESDMFARYVLPKLEHGALAV